MHSWNQIGGMLAQSLQGDVGETSQQVLPLLIAAVDGLARDDIIRRSLAHDPDCWQAFLHAIVSSLPLLLPSPANTLSTWSAVRRLHLMVNVFTVLAGALHCMQIHRRALPFAWFDRQHLNHHFSSHWGKSFHLSY